LRSFFDLRSAFSSPLRSRLRFLSLSGEPGVVVSTVGIAGTAATGAEGLGGTYRLYKGAMVDCDVVCDWECEWA
jgi:hypothetical protein